MFAASLLAATVAALTANEVVFLDTTTKSPNVRVALPCPGLGLFAAPDGRMLVPLRCDDATLVLTGAASQERWRGRVFPLFFGEWDRMYVVLRHEVATWSYPDRVPLATLALSGIEGARKAACSRDGRVVAVAPTDSPARLLITAVLGWTAPASILLSAPASAIVLAPDGGVAAVGQSNGFLTLVSAGGNNAQKEKSVGSNILALCWSANERDLLVSVEGPAGPALVGLRIGVKATAPVKERFRTVLPAVAFDIQPVGDEIAAATANGVLLIAKGGRGAARLLPLPGVSHIAVPPAEPRSALPAWSGT